MTSSGFCKSFLVVLCLSLSAGALAANTLIYYGGRVISHVQVVEVDWGPNVDAATKAGLPGFYTAITQSEYLDWLEEYDTHIKAHDMSAGSNQVIGRGSFVGAFVITPSATGTALTDTQVQSELAAQIAAGTLPAPHVDANGFVDTLYMVEFPPGVSITNPSGGVSCVEFCAYHGSWQAPAGSEPYAGKTIPYSVQPDFNGACGAGCGSATTTFQNQTSVHSHQLVEAITDTDVALAQTIGPPVAWYNTSNGEIGDICNAQQGLLAGYTVQSEWSNSQAKCIISNPTVSICNGSNGPACRLCNPSDEGTGCVAPTAHCDATSGDPLEGRCVECADATGCTSVHKPICDTSSGVCRACAAADCSGALSICETSGAHAGACVACTATDNLQCPNGMPLCDPATDTCVQCLAASDCPPATPVCDANHNCQSAGTSGVSSGGTTTGGTTTGGGTSGGATTGGSGSTSGGASGTTTSGGTSSGQKSGCATGGFGLVFPWPALLLLRRRRAC